MFIGMRRGFQKNLSVRKSSVSAHMLIASFHWFHV